MASYTNSCALSKPEYQMLSHIIDMEPGDLNTSKCNIYKVPCNLRNRNNEAYTPQLISIGPLHFGQECLNPMQQQKLRYFHFFWVRVNNDRAREGYKRHLEEEEEALRRCYADRLPFSKEKFVQILLLDAVFIMELFLRISLKEEHEDDCILKQTWLKKSIQRDLLLLENQIPMDILEKLYDSVVHRAYKPRHQRFMDLAHDYFKVFDPHKSNCSDETEKPDSDNKLSKNCNDSVCCWLKKSSNSFGEDGKRLHFTDLIRYFYLCKVPPPYEKGSSCGVLPTEGSCCNLPCIARKHKKRSSSNVLRTATKLQEAGVSFKKVKDKHLLDIKFKKHKILGKFLCLGCIPKFTYFQASFQIPQLKIDHTTECVLRNLIAFEQCHYAKQPYICNYVSLIDSLIHTKDDVELLVEEEVIVHDLGSDKEVATLVNGLCKHVVTDKTFYQDIIDELNEHYQSLWNRTMATLRLVYFRDTWRASSTVVGIFVLIFTIFNFSRIVRLVL